MRYSAGPSPAPEKQTEQSGVAPPSLNRPPLPGLQGQTVGLKMNRSPWSISCLSGTEHILHEMFSSHGFVLQRLNPVGVACLSKAPNRTTFNPVGVTCL